MDDPQPPPLNKTGLGGEAWKVNLEPRRLLQVSKIVQAEDEQAYFVDFVPPSRDAIELPSHVVYILVGVALVVVATYAIVGHLIDDLLHDLADWILGPKSTDVDAEGGVEGKDEDEQGSFDDGGVQNKKDGMKPERSEELPVFCHVSGNDHLYFLPLRSTSPALPSERRTSIPKVTFDHPTSPSFVSCNLT